MRPFFAIIVLSLIMGGGLALVPAAENEVYLGTLKFKNLVQAEEAPKGFIVPVSANDLFNFAKSSSQGVEMYFDVGPTYTKVLAFIRLKELNALVGLFDQKMTPVLLVYEQSMPPAYGWFTKRDLRVDSEGNVIGHRPRKHYLWSLLALVVGIMGSLFRSTSKKASWKERTTHGNPTIA